MWRHFSVLAFLFLGFVLSANCFAENDSAVKVKWGYTGNIGPSRWEQLSPAFRLCALGKFQSPINITTTKETGMVLTINYLPAPLNIALDDETILQVGKEKVVVNDGHTIQVNFGPDIPESIIFADQIYRLVQFHFHIPSENKWQGRAYPMELHFVHQSDDGHIAILGVFANTGEENTELQTITNNIPQDRGETHLITGKNIDLLSLLPADKDFYYFVGSLTTPPCLEGVQWFVMAKPITLSPAQLARFKHVIQSFNARPVQPLLGRTIYHSNRARVIMPKANLAPQPRS